MYSGCLHFLGGSVTKATSQWLEAAILLDSLFGCFEYADIPGQGIFRLQLQEVSETGASVP